MQITMRDWLMLAALSILWGGAFFFVAVAVQEIPPLTLVLARVGIACLTLFIYLKANRMTVPVDAKVMLAFLTMGFFNNLIPFSLLFWAQTSISSGLASILNATTPIFSILVAHFVLADERMSVNKIIGVLLGFSGVAILLGGNALNGVDTATFGILACLGAALSYGIASVYGRRFRAMGMAPGVGAFGQLAATTVMMIPIVVLIDQPWTLPLPSIAAIGATVALAVASTALAYLLYFRLLANTGAVNSALVTLLIPPSAILLGTIFLHEVLEPQHLLGMTLILIGLISVDGRLLAKFQK